MRKPLMAALAAVLLVGACATVRDSRINPFNWFGRSERAVAVATPGTAAAQDGRVQVAQVTFLAVEPTPGGAILRATGLPPTQGWWDGKLVEEPTDVAGDLVYRFMLQPPPDARRVSTSQSREVTVALFLSDFKLQGVRRVTVTGAGNARTTARR